MFLKRFDTRTEECLFFFYYFVGAHFSAQILKVIEVGRGFF
jgi:hypothetical protein